MPKVCITGICGFLGTHVADYFKKQDWEVVGIDNLTNYELDRAGFNAARARAYNLEFLKSINVQFHVSDCRNVVADFFKLIDGKSSIDLIIHCAAQPAMTVAIEEPKYDAENNILGCVNMLNVARELNVPFVNCSSIHVYGNSGNEKLQLTETRFKRTAFENDEIDETALILQGELTPLHVSKYATELYTQSFDEMYGMKTASFRITGMFGERQFGGMDHGWVANFAIRNIMEREITIFGTDKQVRDILYAEDVARAFYLWFLAGCPTGIYNIGGGMKNSISLGECFVKISNITGIPQSVKIEEKRKGDLWYFVCDYRKAEREFGWEPQVSVDEGLQRITKWIKENKELFE
jgi:CDP-paratose 2-epimerase